MGLILSKSNLVLEIVTAAVLISSSVWLTTTIGIPTAMAQTTTVFCAKNTATIVGTPDNDNLVGTPGRDVISALGGDDTIAGLGGNDTICGDAGNDVMSGGTGDDFITGQQGNDDLKGNSGNDRLVSLLDSIANNDKFDGVSGTDTCESDPDPEVNCEI